MVSESFDAARALMQAGIEPDLFCAAGLGDVERIRAFFSPEGRLKPGASRTGSSRYAPDGTRLPCPPGTDREIVSDALYMAARNGHEGAVRELLTRGPDLAFRAFAQATRCTGPTSRARPRWWPSCSPRGPTPRSAIPC